MPIQPVASPIILIQSLSLIWHSGGTIELCLVSGFENADFPFCHPSNSVIQAHHPPHHGGRGEGGKPFSKSIVCKKGEGDADGQVLWLSDWFSTPTHPALLYTSFPLYHFSPYHHSTISLYHYTTIPLYYYTTFSLCLCSYCFTFTSLNKRTN